MMDGPKDDLDNHANQLNPEHDAYWQSRGYDERPDDSDDGAGADFNDCPVEDYAEDWEHND